MPVSVSVFIVTSIAPKNFSVVAVTRALAPHDLHITCCFVERWTFLLRFVASWVDRPPARTVEDVLGRGAGSPTLFVGVNVVPDGAILNTYSRLSSFDGESTVSVVAVQLDEDRPASIHG